MNNNISTTTSPVRSILAILAGGVLTFFLGGLWYSPLIAGDAWGAATGVDVDALAGAEQGRLFGTTILMFTIIATGLRILMADRASALTGLRLGATCGALLAASYATINGAWELESSALIVQNILWAIVSFAFCGLIVGTIARPRPAKIEATSAAPIVA